MVGKRLFIIGAFFSMILLGLPRDIHTSSYVLDVVGCDKSCADLKERIRALSIEMFRYEQQLSIELASIERYREAAFLKKTVTDNISTPSPH
jgi:hypothetical protein